MYDHARAPACSLGVLNSYLFKPQPVWALPMEGFLREARPEQSSYICRSLTVSEPTTHQKLTFSPWNVGKLSLLRDRGASAGEGHLAMETRAHMSLGFPRAGVHRCTVLT